MIFDDDAAARSNVDPRANIRPFSRLGALNWTKGPANCGEISPMLKRNRSAPDSAVITVLFYPDVPQAVAWLTTALPFTERLRNSEDRRQLVHGNGAIVVTKAGLNANEPPSTQQKPGAQLITLRVTQVDELFERARKAGAHVLTEPSDRPYGERQCAFVDPWGHAWTLSETIFDSDPHDWGGELLGEE